MGPNSKVSLKETREMMVPGRETAVQRQEVKAGVMRPLAMECLEPPEAGKERKDPPLETSEGGYPADTLI